jgi:DNA primase catalytic core
MSELTDWINYELYPSLFEAIPKALPEHNFRKVSGDWNSKTYLDGSPHKTRGNKTVVTKKIPGRILEQGGETLSLVDYVVRRDSGDFIQAVKTLAEVVGLTLPTSSDFDQESYRNHKERATVLEDANSYFIYCLQKSPNAKEVRDYLTSRGYSSEDIEAMELGYIPSQEKLYKYLKDKKGHATELIEESLKLNKAIGDTHSFTIPYRSGGSIKGFKFRTIGDATPKYLNSTGLDRSGGFFNLSGISGDKDVVIVEGELDSLHATVKGLGNVVATGGSSVNSEQVKDAIRRGAKSFTICLDREPGKEEETAKRVNSVIEVILGEGVNRVYIVNLEDLGGPKTDPDKLLKEKGVEALRGAINEAKPYYFYWLGETFNKFGKLQEERGLTHRDTDKLLEEIVETANRIPEPLQRDQYKQLFIEMPGVKGLGVTEESLSITLDRITSTKNKEDQSKELQRLLSTAKDLQDKGETDEALELLAQRVKDVRLTDKTTEFSKLLLPIKENELRERRANKPESLNSGYTIGGEELPLPSGAISVFTAPTSHGKTSLLINLALNVTKSYPDKETYVFSYEEDGDTILLNALNTYIDQDLSTNNRKSLNSYFTTGSTEYIKKDNVNPFTAYKDEFFRDLVTTGRLNVHYSNYNSDTLIDAIRYLHKHANPGAIFIDYIQLLNLPEGKYKTYSRQEEIKEICIALKDVAVETGLPIILGAQFNRTVTNQLHLHATKIGEAGDIERIANLIVGFWNNNFKPLATDGELEEINRKGGSTPDTIYATILKNRGGRVGLEEILSWNGNTGRIKNIEGLNPF